MQREVLFEVTPSGSIVKVTAIDAETGIEAVIQGPVSAGQHALKQAALKKLVYLLEKQKKKK
jgi:hypothetical protein